MPTKSQKMGHFNKYPIRSNKPDLTKCKKHPKHKQSPGVCSICLIEKLSQLSVSSSSRSTIHSISSSSSSSSLSSYSTASCSSYSSPMRRYRFHNNTNDKASSSLSFLLMSGKNVLTKSRSLVFVPRNKGNKEIEASNDKKKGGFLSKLLRPRNKRIQEGLIHSTTMRERVIDITTVD